MEILYKLKGDYKDKESNSIEDVLSYYRELGGITEAVSIDVYVVVEDNDYKKHKIKIDSAYIIV